VATTLRRLLPAAILAPALLGWVLAALVRGGLLGFDMAIALASVAFAVGAVAFLRWTTRQIRRLEQSQHESEASVRRAFESSLVPTLVVGPEGRVQASNAIAQRLFGYTAEEFNGLPVEQLVPAAARAGHVRLRAEFAEHPTSRPMGPDRELFACRKDGSEFPVEIGLNPVPTQAGPTVVATIIDISERIESQHRLRENEQRLSLLFEATQDAIWDCDVASDTVWWNRAAERLLGIRSPEAETSWEWWRAHVHAEDRDEAFASLRAAIDDGAAVWNGEYRFVRDDGKVLFIRDRARIARNAAGRALRVVGAMQDQTDAREAEMQLRASEARFRAMADQSPMLMWILDHERHVTYVNPAWVSFTGQALNAARGGGWLSAVHPDDRERVAAELAGAIAQRDAFVQEYRLSNAKGQYRWVLWQGLPWSAQADGLEGYIGCGVDIDRMKQAMDDLKRSNVELEHFAYVASHDLQEPLRMVSSFCQLLEQRYADKLGDEGREFIGFAVDGARRMQRLIADLLQYSRVGRRDMQFERLSTQVVCDRALRNLQHTIAEASATVRCGTLPELIGNDGQLTMVFQNLIGNAVKFQAQTPPFVDVAAEPRGNGWLFTVRDNGIGIDPRHVERIFRVFQRLHTREQYPGSGIGLSICKKVVEAHGGWIRVEPNPAGGSVFSFWLPATPNEQASDSPGVTAVRVDGATARRAGLPGGDDGGSL